MMIIILVHSSPAYMRLIGNFYQLQNLMESQGYTILTCQFQFLNVRFFYCFRLSDARSARWILNHHR